MSTQHTLGPWWHSGLEVGTEPMMMVKVAKVSGANHQEALANARLIAAAPDLLEALNTWLKQYSAEEYEDCPEVVQTRAAITKATGETKCKSKSLPPKRPTTAFSLRLHAEKKSASVYIGSSYINVLCKNASHRAWGGLGKTFQTAEEAVAGYKTSEMKAIIQSAFEMQAATA
jgi:hypothetical protein